MSDERDEVANLLSSLGTVDGRVVLAALMPDGSISMEIGGQPLTWAIADALYVAGYRLVKEDDEADS